MITNSFAGWFDFLYQSFVNPHLDVSDNGLSLATGSIILILGIWSKSYFRNRIYVLNMFGPSKKRIRNSEVLKKLKYEDLIINEREIDVVRMHESNKRKMYLNSHSIQDEVEEKVKTYIEESRESKRAFTGMSPIPLTCLAGTYFLQNHIDTFIEYDRNDQCYKKIDKKKTRFRSKKDNYQSLIRDGNLDSIEKTTEVIVSVSTTKTVQKHDLVQFDTLPVLNFYIASRDDNSLSSYNQIMNYTKTICDAIEEVKELYNVQKVHLLIASQSALVIEVGRLIGMNENRYPEIVAYHYNHSGNCSYPYGLIVNGSKKGQPVFYEETKNV